MFRKRFRIPFVIFKKIVSELRPELDCAPTNKGGVESIPLEIKILACLRHMGRGEVWDTIKELCDNVPSISTLSTFFHKFVKVFRAKYQDEFIHPPQSQSELDSVFQRSAARGMAGCCGFMDGVHVHWGSCPAQWRFLCTGKSEYPTIGWQCVVNHRRRFMSVMSVQSCMKQ